MEEKVFSIIISKDETGESIETITHAKTNPLTLGRYLTAILDSMRKFIIDSGAPAEMTDLLIEGSYKIHRENR